MGLRHPNTRRDGHVLPYSFTRAIEAAILEKLADKLRDAERLTCKWSLNDDESGTWESSCGELWSFIDGGPKENRVTYCHHCGGKVSITAEGRAKEPPK